MTTNLAIDDALLAEAFKEGAALKKKKDTVHEALREYIQKRKQKKILALFGTIDFDSTYNQKQGCGRV